ncbi:MAG: shikimate dehydrogenase [Sulfolobaceae archaeon]
MPIRRGGVKIVLISPTTKIYALVGKGISYSLSPYIHNFSFNKLNINAVYVVFDLNEDKFNKAIDGLLEVIEGVNVTIPYKELIIRHLDEVDEVTRRIGAVNTIYNKRGYNTDYIAIKKLVQRKLKSLNGFRCYIMGAGGAGKAAAYALGELGCKILINNRTKERALEVIKNLSSFGIEAEYVNDCNLNYDVLVNATPYPQNIREECIRGLLVVDLVYRPIKTYLILNAMKKGIDIIDGLSILINQAIEAQKIWFGKSLDEEQIREYICQEILSEEC